MIDLLFAAVVALSCGERPGASRGQLNHTPR
jgi:hypothetical protein